MTKSHGTRRGLLLILAVVTLVVLGVSIRFGAIDFSVADISQALSSLIPGHAEPTLNQRIFLELRLPRAVLCLFVGASLGVGGTLMQALFRNPIVEPGLVGTSSGAAFTLLQVCGRFRSPLVSAASFPPTSYFCWQSRARMDAPRS